MLHDDFDTEIQPEELFNEDLMDDNPTDEDFEPYGDWDCEDREDRELHDEFNDGEGW